jgi:G:T/U mismatch-specific DNA glycosylase
MQQHPISPVYDRHCSTLILGTFPSVASREAMFFYGHPQNRFWRVLAAVFGAEAPITHEEKTAFLIAHNIALWDVIQSCAITGSSDSSIKNVTANNITGLIAKAPITRIFTNGMTAHRLYQKYCAAAVGITDTPLPSTSPANAAYSLEKLIDHWKIIAH